MRLRSHLILIVLGMLLPVLVLTAVLIVLHHAEMRRATEAGFEETARVLLAGVDRELGASIGALQVLAASEAIRTGNPREFNRGARALLASQSRWTNLALYDASGSHLASPLVPLATPVPMGGDPTLIERVVVSRTPIISNLYKGRQSEKPFVRVAVPVLANGTLRYVLAASLDLASLVEPLSHSHLPSGSLVSLTDLNYVIVSRSRAAEQFVGQPATPDFVAQASRMSQGSFRATTKEGELVHVAISRSPLSGWTLGLGVPQAVVDGPLRASLWVLTGAAALMVLIGTTLALIMGRRLERPMLALVRTAPRLAQGEVITLPRSSVTEMRAVATAVEEASRELHRGQQAAAASARVSRAFTDTPDVATVGRQIVEHVLPLFESASASLRLLGSDGSLQSVARHSAWATPPELAPDVLPPGMGIAGTAVSAGIPIQSPNVPEDSVIQLTEGVRRLMVESGVVAWLAVPLRVNSKVIGALSIGARMGRVFRPAEVTLLQTFADQAALALEQARLFEESEHRRQTAEALADVGRLLSQTLDSHSVGLRIVASVQALLAARSAILYTLEADAGILIAHTVSTDLGPLSWTPRLERGVGTAWLAVEQRCPITTPDVVGDDRVVLPSDVRARLAPATHRALLAVPLILPDRIVGALVVACGTGRVWSEQDAQIAQAFAAQAAIALENADLYAQSERSRRASTALAATSRLLAQAHGIETVGQRVVESVRSLIGGTVAILYRFEPASGAFVSTAVSSDRAKKPGNIVPRGIGASALAARERVPIATPDITEDARIVLSDDLAQRYANVSDRAVLAVPLLLHDDVVIGSLLVRDHSGRVFKPEEIELARSFADHVVVALESVRLHEQQVMLAHEEERRRITYDLHDGIAQLVVGAKQRLDTCQDFWTADPPRARQELEAGVQHLGRTITEMRRVLRALRPLPLDFIGLAGAIRDILKEAAREAGWAADLVENVGAARFSPTIETAVFRIAQEALANARRHARATRVDVRVEQHSDWLELEICDDGVGAGALGQSGSGSRGLGFLSMRERATALGGTCAVTSEPGRGTTIAARIPLNGRVSA